MKACSQTISSTGLSSIRRGKGRKTGGGERSGGGRSGEERRRGVGGGVVEVVGTRMYTVMPHACI